MWYYYAPGRSATYRRTWQWKLWKRKDVTESQIVESMANLPIPNKESFMDADHCMWGFLSYVEFNPNHGSSGIGTPG